MRKLDETKRLLANLKHAKKVRKARKELREGKGVKMDVMDLWK